LTTVQNWEKGLQAKAQVRAATGAVGAGQIVGDPMDTPKQAQGIARKAAYFLLRRKPQKSHGVQAHAIHPVGHFRKSAAQRNGKTQLAPPPADLATSLSAMISNKEFKPALDQS